MFNITNTFHLPALGLSIGVEREERLQLETKMKDKNFKRKEKRKKNTIVDSLGCV